jgi:hypothetical protein
MRPVRIQTLFGRKHRAGGIGAARTEGAMVTGSGSKKCQPESLASTDQFGTSVRVLSG